MSPSGSPLDFLWAFFGGVLISFTPCVFPLIPVTINYIGVNATQSRLRGLSLSLVYVSGMALVYSLLGLFASLTGQIFGQVSSHPVTYIITGTVIIFFGLSMFDLFSLSLTNFIRLPRIKSRGYFSVFLLGAVSGLIIGPCLSPALGAILAYLVAKKNILYGMFLLFCFAYGMGLALILAGTFSGFLLKIPKSGKWLGYTKIISGIIILVLGAYFVYSGIRRF